MVLSFQALWRRHVLETYGGGAAPLGRPTSYARRRVSTGASWSTWSPPWHAWPAASGSCGRAFDCTYDQISLVGLLLFWKEIHYKHFLMVISMTKSRVLSNFMRGINNFGLNCILLFQQIWSLSQKTYKLRFEPKLLNVFLRRSSLGSTHSSQKNESCRNHWIWKRLWNKFSMYVNVKPWLYIHNRGLGGFVVVCF